MEGLELSAQAKGRQRCNPEYDETGDTVSLAGPAGSRRPDYHILQLTRSRSYRHIPQTHEDRVKLRLLQYETLPQFGLV